MSSSESAPAVSSGAEASASVAVVPSDARPSAQADADAPVDEIDKLPPRTVQFNGPDKIAVKALHAWVHLYPDDETPYLGYLRAGAIVDRSKHWVVRTMRCKEGWYEVLPRGYVCNGRRATLDLNDPVVVASWKPPRRGQPLPYYYVRPSGTRTYLYFKLPTEREQERTEGATLKTSAGARNPQLIPNVSVLGEPEPLPDFLLGGKPLSTPFGATKRLRYAVHEGRANPSAAFALLSVHQHGQRLFGLTTELDLVAIDRTTIVVPTQRHGGPIESLPAGIVHGGGAPRFVLDGDAIRRDGDFRPYQVVDLTGQTHRDLWQVRDGSYVRAGHFEVVEPRTSFPSFATEGRKWLDISIKQQVLVAYVGTTPVYLAQVSTGLGELADPAKSFATVRGSFTIVSKHVTATMSGSAQADSYEIADVPYVQYFHEGYALHAAFWHDNFGRVQSHGCVNLPPADAAWLFEWTDPPVPPEWHGANATEDQPGTVVHVRP